MQPQLTTRDGNVIPLTDEIYETILLLVRNRSDIIDPAESIDELEDEFSALFVDSASTSELLAEHAHELTRENRKLERFD